MQCSMRTGYLRVPLRGLGILVIISMAWLPRFARGVPDEAFAITFSDGERIYTTQCGLNVATFLLEYFQRDYDLEQVAAELEPDADGIALGRLQTVLQTYGLDAVARQNIKLHDLRKPLKSGALAVLSIKAGLQQQSRHYVIALYDRNRGYLLADVPRQVASLFDTLNDGRLSEPVALFVARPAASPNELREQVELQPDRLDLGRFELEAPGGQNPIEHAFAIRNRGATPIRYRVEADCSCLRPDRSGGILAPGEARQITLKVWPGQWGIGRNVHSLFLTFPDRSERRLEVEAEGIARALYSFVLSRRTFTLDCTEMENGATVDCTVDVSFAGAPPDSFTATSQTSWLTAATELLDNQHGRIVITAHVSPDVFVGGRLQAEGEVTVTGYVLKPTETIKVRLLRREFFSFDRASVGVSQSADAAPLIAVRPVPNLANHVKVVHAQADRPGLSVEITATDEGVAALQINPAQSEIGQYTLRCELQSDRGAIATAYLIVTVRE
jgi:hypothetical protein